ncbi:MAG TPA: 30S ribosomal protein S13, partial [Actinomycetota bacterium]|nr:30S ribosomal protein S13 [Actinomycetota bacterium]
MARIGGVDLPRDKRLDIGLTYIYGVGKTKAMETCIGAQVNPSTKVRDLTDEEVVRIRDFIGTNYRIEGDLRREVNQHIKRKIEIGSYQGLRHRRGLPVRGQRTH